MNLARHATAVGIAMAMGCAGPTVTVRRLLWSTPLETAKPQNPCEEASFLEIVRSNAEATSQSQTHYDGYSLLATGRAWGRGLSLYRIGQDEPQLLLPLFSGPGDKALIADHLALMKPTLEKRNIAFWLDFTGYGAVAVSLGLITAGVVDQAMGGRSSALFTGASLGVILAGLVVVLVGQSMYPKPEDLAALMVRERMLIPSEVDVEAFRRAVRERNQQARERCSRK